MTAIIERGAPGSWTGPVSDYDSQALAVSGVVKASSAVLYRISGLNNSSSQRFIHVYNSATVPADGAVPAVMPIPVPPGGVFSLGFDTLPGSDGVLFSDGLSWASSTTLETKTVTGVADVWATITFK